jgi:pimeloyl-ACP methyl ester carboxylesterase
MVGTLTNKTLNSQFLNTARIGDTGHPILIMHGWGQSLEGMRPLGELIGKSQQVHLIDLPGFGKSPKPAEDWDSIGYSERIYQYMQDNGLERVDVLGHSFGGKVATRLAARHPEAVRGLILMDASGLKRVVTGKKKLRGDILRTLSKLLKWSDKNFKTTFFESWFVPKFGSRDYKNAGELRNILVKTVNEDVTPDAQKITSSALIIWGELDDETPVEMGERFNRLIKDSQLIVLPRKDHFPYLNDGVHLCARYILDFLNKLPAAETK